jgi:hypothetical protein
MLRMVEFLYRLSVRREGMMPVWCALAERTLRTATDNQAKLYIPYNSLTRIHDKHENLCSSSFEYRSRRTCQGDAGESREILGPLGCQVCGEARAQVAPAAPKVKHKLIRDSFTIPKSEYSVLESLKLRALALARPTKKSELLRAGIAALSAMSDKQFLAAVSSIPSLKTGRPKTDAPAQSAGM